MAIGDQLWALQCVQLHIFLTKTRRKLLVLKSEANAGIL